MSQAADQLVLPRAQPDRGIAPEAQRLEDLRLAERVERALCATGYGFLRAARVSVVARKVVLEGQVPSYYLKQVAQATALAVPGVHLVRNDLDVGPPSGQHRGGMIDATSERRLH